MVGDGQQQLLHCLFGDSCEQTGGQEPELREEGAASVGGGWAHREPATAPCASIPCAGGTVCTVFCLFNPFLPRAVRPLHFGLAAMLPHALVSLPISSFCLTCSPDSYLLGVKGEGQSRVGIHAPITPSSQLPSAAHGMAFLRRQLPPYPPAASEVVE